MADRAREKQLPRKVVQEQLAMQLPSQEPEQFFDTLVGWARYAELLGYEPEAHLLYLDQPDAERMGTELS